MGAEKHMLMSGGLGSAQWRHSHVLQHSDTLSPGAPRLGERASKAIAREVPASAAHHVDVAVRHLSSISKSVDQAAKPGAARLTGRDTLGELVQHIHKALASTCTVL